MRHRSVRKANLGAKGSTGFHFLVGASRAFWRAHFRSSLLLLHALAALLPEGANLRAQGRQLLPGRLVLRRQRLCAPPLRLQLTRCLQALLTHPHSGCGSGNPVELPSADGVRSADTLSDGRALAYRTT